MNRLKDSPSPYLRQHAHNPVDWYPWGEEAFQKAKEDDKLLIISIGYSACHWCHVMERECFEDLQVARLMNQHYISIKVDREEHTDVDQIYMDALQLMTGRGGWPLNIIALPDGRPVWGVTYLPKKSWISALTQISEIKQKEPAQLLEYADKLSQSIKVLHATPLVKGFEKPSADILNTAAQNLLKNRDFQTGGPDRAPKFMMPSQLLSMLKIAVFTGQDQLSRYVHTTLQNISRRGIFDHTAGVFYRYSTDDQWKIPHFEKMLYDNALLIETYAEAYKHSRSENYIHTIQKTLHWLHAEMANPEGGFYAALDADAEGEEGKTYTFTPAEIHTMLQGLHQDFLRDLYSLHPGEQWEGLYVLHQSQPLEHYLQKHHLTLSQAADQIEQFLTRARQIRSAKPRPGVDDKVIAAWNALLTSALVTAYEATGHPSWLQQAKDLFRTIYQIITHGAHYQKKSAFHARCLLDDLATAIRAAIRLFSTTGDPSYLQTALAFTERAYLYHNTPEQILFTNTPQHDTLLIHKSVDTEDNVIPSSNALMAENLLLLGHITGHHEYTERSQAMLNAMRDRIIDHPEAYYHWWYVHLLHAAPLKLYVITGPRAHQKALPYRSTFYPDSLVLSTDQLVETDIFLHRFHPHKDQLFLCIGESCRPPEELH
ncbi:thioredoxin domain-containing protein [Schleiferia thermophila]|uniref:thioredoxin domain-containing protein n=1 Tax=Schleiferia thermophila TaxID=884107 RepID=UPI002FDAA883